MKAVITPAKLAGCVKAPASKSVTHRLLICAALADRPTDIVCEGTAEDVEATARALDQLGSDIVYDRERGLFRVVPARRRPDDCVLDVGESGSTLRFLLPVVCAMGIKARLRMRGRLPQRPLSPLWEELERHGCSLTRDTDGTVEVQGRLRGGEFRMASDVSSQFISGLLFALPLMEEPSFIRLCGPVESEGYIRMTIRALEQFGVRTTREGDVMTVSSAPGKHCADGSAPVRSDGSRRTVNTGYISPGTIRTEGDWSGAAFWEIAGMLTDGGAGSIACTGLDEYSGQGDRAVRQLKLDIARGGAVVDARNVPDLVPALSVLASVSPGRTVFTHAGRLRLKESDRIRSAVAMLRSLGGQAEETEDGFIVHGQDALRGGCVDSFRDHRIVMSAAVASIVCEDKVVISGAEAVGKSYPAFWEDFGILGGNVLFEP
ncbi:MAG: 3-phosphoshikimate 1-carboxyvinyltransferase [Clostridia bacterium]|nr:3-phosphoshikimate 1-carboxyvinyltransferase [Clostridia bacterium]